MQKEYLRSERGGADRICRGKGVPAHSGNANPVLDLKLGLLGIAGLWIKVVVPEIMG